MNMEEKINRIDNVIQIIFAKKAAKLQKKADIREARKQKIASIVAGFTRTKKNVEETVSNVVNDVKEGVKDGVQQGLQGKADDIETVVGEVIN